MASSDSLPLMVRLGAGCDPFLLFESLSSKKTRVLLESARTGTSGRYSFIASDPLKSITIDARDHKAERLWDELRAALKARRVSHALPYPFVGGWMGYLSYECKDLIEHSLRSHGYTKEMLPLAHFSLFDHVVVVDHLKDETVLVVSSSERSQKAQLRELTGRYSAKLSQSSKSRSTSRAAGHRLSSQKIETSLDRPAFQQAVRTIKEHIRRGDVFQVNLAQRLRFPLKESANAIYRRLRALNPSSYFGIYDTGSFQILSGSPERLLSLRGGLLETRPIAGTRARGKDDAADRKVSQELFLSPKERAEHIMLVDLERNDMGRVAEYGSVEVDELMSLENYSHVKHIVSNVRAVLKQGLDAVDAIKAFFPGGTITGAPKIRSMQIISQLEPVRRGPYTGSLGYLSFSGNMDMNILIRSLVIKDGVASLHVGAGIVADSIPEKEYEETLYKAEAVLCAVFGQAEVARFFRRCGLKS